LAISKSKRTAHLKRAPFLLGDETGQKMNLIDKLAWIQIVDRKILSTRSHEKYTFYLPGGKREGAESDQEALIREISEELSVRLLPETLRYLGTFEAQAHGKAGDVTVRMTCYTGSYEGALQAAAEIEEMRWFVHADWEKCSQVDKLIFDWLKERDLID
jgi:8-oxo-dGTP diphosphatase